MVFCYIDCFPEAELRAAGVGDLFDNGLGHIRSSLKFLVTNFLP